MIKGFQNIFRISLILFLAIFLVVYPASALKPNDPDYFLQWQIEKINLPLAWDYTQGSSEIVVAILDTGIDITHPDLAANIWVNSGEIAGDGIDNDGNGYIDDVNGYDFLDNDADPAVDFSQPYALSGITHGTVVAGLIGAVGNNLRGITGVAWNVRLMPLRVLDNYGSASVEPTIRAINYAINNGADIINLSFQGNLVSEELEAVLARAYEQGVVSVGAAGNGDGSVGYNLDETEFYPVCYNTKGRAMVIGVGSSSQDDQLSKFSNYGKKCIDLLAPGEYIHSTQAYRGPQTDLDVYYSGYWEGTSLAAPIVSGVAALIKSINKDFSPELVYKFLTETAEPVKPLSSHYADKLGFGRVNAGEAIKAAVDYNNNNSDPVQQTSVRPSGLHLANGLVVGAAAGHQPEVKIFNSQHQEENKFLAYGENFFGGVNLTAADINNNNQVEVITAAGRGGGPHIRIFNQAGGVISQFFAYAKNFRGGVNVASGDVDGDGELEIITIPQSLGGPHIRVFDWQGNLKYQFMADNPDSRGGWNLAVGDLNLDGRAEIIIAPAKGTAGSKIKILNYHGNVLAAFEAYSKSFKGGVSLAVGDVDNDYRAEIIAGPESSSLSEIKIFDQYGKKENKFLAFTENYLGGVKLAVGDYNFDGLDELIVVRASGEAEIKIFNNQGEERAKFFGFSQGYTGGAIIAIIE